jgi:hypothetical protein
MKPNVANIVSDLKTAAWAVDGFEGLSAWRHTGFMASMA